MPTGNAYLFCWNPNKWNWEYLDDEIQEFREQGALSGWWTCLSHKQIQAGDRAFLLKLGVHPKGIFASGYISARPSLGEHWNKGKKEGYSVPIEYDFMVHPLNDSLLTLDYLKQGNLKNQNWTPQGSGVLIKKDVAENLERVWFNFLTRNKFAQTVATLPKSSGQDHFMEGKVSQVILTSYERNPYARKACIDFYGFKCSVCLFNFEEFYGEVGKDFIHVHHLNPISKFNSIYEIDPVKDLRPVCPNCHAMLHKENPPFAIEKLQSIIQRKKRTSKKLS